MEIIISLLIVATIISVFMTGYCFGRADGIKWTKDVYQGKHDEEIYGK